MSDISPTNRIYLTYKARIIAEAKLRLFSRLANMLIIWFSFWMIVASIAVASEAIMILHYEIIFASASIAIFASSIFLATGTLDKRADEFRACYLEMQMIWNSNVSEAAKMKRYGEALARYPNHSSRDDADMIFSSWRRGGGKLYDTRGEVPYSARNLLPAGIRLLFFWVITALVFLAPLLFAPRFIEVVAIG